MISSEEPRGSMSPDDVQQLIVTLLTARNESRELELEQLRAAFPVPSDSSARVMLADFVNSLAGLVEFVHEVRAALRADDTQWDAYFEQVIRRFAFE